MTVSKNHLPAISHFQTHSFVLQSSYFAPAMVRTLPWLKGAKGVKEKQPKTQKTVFFTPPAKKRRLSTPSSDDLDNLPSANPSISGSKDDVDSYAKNQSESSLQLYRVLLANACQTALLPPLLHPPQSLSVPCAPAIASTTDSVW